IKRLYQKKNKKVRRTHEKYCILTYIRNVMEIKNNMEQQDLLLKLELHFL
uniref:Uncharacterized protein n=1 Tax=Amphimedon queenslandica TaxID=400682 RepID=A0A1X7V1C1_AMPQE